MIDQVTLSHFGQVGLKQNSQIVTLEMCMHASCGTERQLHVWLDGFIHS